MTLTPSSPYATRASGFSSGRGAVAIRLALAFSLWCAEATSAASAAPAALPTATGCNPTLKWSWEGFTRSPSYPFACITPLVVQLGDDDGDGRITVADVPDVVFPHCENYSSGCHIVAIDGQLGRELFDITSHRSVGNLAAGDLDGDGVVEIVAMLSPESRLGFFRNDGSLAGLSDTWPAAAGSNAYVSLADLDQDGRPEIIASDHVLDSAGTILWALLGANGAFQASAVDLDAASPGLEVLDGDTLWSAQGALLWDAGLGRGFAAVGDVTGDGVPEIVFLENPYDFDHRVHLLDCGGAPIGLPFTVTMRNPGRNLPTPVVADLDGDGRAEIFVVRQDDAIALGWDGSELVVEWSFPHLDSSGLARASGFDFDGDGAVEILYRDQESAYVLDGRSGAALATLPTLSATIDEHPIVADIDGDCQAEILVSGCRDDGQGRASAIRAYDCNAPVTPRPIVNQYVYLSGNVNADGTIPTSPAAPWSGGRGWVTQVADDARRPFADAGPPVEICAGASVRLDGVASRACPGSTLEYEWREDATIVCPWSSASGCDVTPAATTTYVLEVRCLGGRACRPTDGASVTVAVIPDVVPPDLGNTLLQTRQGLDVAMSWTGQAAARSYSVFRDTAKGQWPAVPLAAGLTATALTLPDVPGPPELYFYRVAGASCSGREGP